MQCKSNSYKVIHNGKPAITVLKSWLSINTSVGCSRGCIYCNKDFYNIGDQTEELLSPEELIDCLKSDWRFYKDKTPISVNSRGIDPFNNGVVEQTFEVLNLLCKEGYKNKIGLITRGPINEDISDRLRKYVGKLNIVLLYTFSGLPKEIEPTSYKFAKNLNSLVLAKGTGHPVVFYLRPLIEGVNDSPEILTNLFKVAEQYADAIVRESIRPNFTITPKLESLGVTIPSEQVNDAAIGRKSLTSNTRTIVEKVYKDLDISIPMFKKTSCAVSFVFRESDYNAHWSKSDTCCSQFCPTIQMKRCNSYSYSINNEDGLKQVTDRTHFDIKDRKVDSSDYFDYERRVFLKHVTKLPIHEKGEECAVGYDVLL